MNQNYATLRYKGKTTLHDHTISGPTIRIAEMFTKRVTYNPDALPEVPQKREIVFELHCDFNVVTGVRSNFRYLRSTK